MKTENLMTKIQCLQTENQMLKEKLQQKEERRSALQVINREVTIENDHLKETLQRKENRLAELADVRNQLAEVLYQVCYTFLVKDSLTFEILIVDGQNRHIVSESSPRSIH